MGSCRRTGRGASSSRSSDWRARMPSIPANRAFVIPSAILFDRRLREAWRGRLYKERVNWRVVPMGLGVLRQQFRYLCCACGVSLSKYCDVRPKRAVLRDKHAVRRQRRWGTAVIPRLRRKVGSGGGAMQFCRLLQREGSGYGISAIGWIGT
jgi:hypothetical protein